MLAKAQKRKKSSKKRKVDDDEIEDEELAEMLQGWLEVSFPSAVSVRLLMLSVQEVCRFIPLGTVMFAKIGSGSLSGLPGSESETKRPV